MEMTLTVSQLISEAVRAKLQPEVSSISVDGRVEWLDGTSGTLRYVIKGKLPSGTYYDVALDLSGDIAAWLNDGELSREIDRAVRAFKVAAALAGMQPRERPNRHPALFGTSRAFGAVGPFRHVLRNSFDILPEE